MKRMKPFRDIIDVIGIFLLAFLIDALIFKHIPFKYQNAIALSDIIGFIITISLALYIAHIVENSREQKRAIITVVSNMIQSLISECEDIQHDTYNQILNYLRAAALAKHITTTCNQIADALERAGISNQQVQKDLKKFKRLTNLRKALTDISDTAQTDNSDFLSVKGNICTIGDTRIGKIQKELINIKKDLYTLSVDINL